MDEALTAKISDFGLAKLLMLKNSRTTIGNDETSGYLAPKWYRDASIFVKYDIYSYGVVLLEIIWCRHSIDVSVLSAEELYIFPVGYKISL